MGLWKAICHHYIRSKWVSDVVKYQTPSLVRSLTLTIRQMDDHISLLTC